MASTTGQYAAAPNEAGSAVEKIADFWTQGAQAFGNHGYLSSALPQADLMPVPLGIGSGCWPWVCRGVRRLGCIR